ncbi:SLAC1 family transporter [Kineococcus sp. SYSU DK003]|uniref:SLAC1 family transporter n=1 Tax=Kineococcus sp. SYSU DK003 TaxID=3383124 RepID=UPI003D7D0808
MSTTSQERPSVSAIAGDQPSTRIRLTPNLFGTSFGLSGLAAAWTAAGDTLGLPGWPAGVLWAVAAAVHVVVLVAYLTDALIHRRLRADVDDPTLGPFTALGAIPLLLLGAELARHSRGVGEVVVVVGAVATLLLGAWLTGGWILRPHDLERWHPGYFLPSVAGGLVAANATARLGWDTIAVVLFGYGAVSWLVLGSILLVRLFTRPALPAALLPTMAIEVAPPVVASNAWFAINGGRSDLVVLLLAGYGVFMALVQLRLLPLYAKSTFGPGFWSFSFSYAALASTVLTWLRIQSPTGAQFWTVVVLAALTLGYALLVARTAVALVRGRYLVRVPVAQPGSPA